MTTFFMFGRYSAESIKGISAKRTQKAAKIIKGLGGKIKCIYALLGPHDLVIVVDLPSVEDAIKAALALFKLTSISFSTSPAVPVEKFDKLSG